MKYLLLLLCGWSFAGFSQDYDLYFTGNSNDVMTNPQGGVCMMGGATEHDEAMKWFLQRADGGDVVVLRASGSDGYNDYFYSQLGITINSVRTFVFNNANPSTDPSVLQHIENAEAIWFAGGDQWNYVSYWRDTPVDSIINAGIAQRNIVVGGTSAGMAILGRYYFSAENGTITSAGATANPYDNNMTVDSTSFLHVNYLENIITDTHYDNPDRRARHSAFLARILTDYGVVGKGIACDEYTAVCIDQNGLARAYGEWPAYNEGVYFIQPNCMLPDFSPESCSPGVPLEWFHNGAALNVYHMYGTMNGDNTFDLTDWSTGVGGSWKSWGIFNNYLQQTIGSQLDCSAGLNEQQLDFSIAPNPTPDYLTVRSESVLELLEVIDDSGKVLIQERLKPTFVYTIDTSKLPVGHYFVRVNGGEPMPFQKIR